MWRRLYRPTHAGHITFYFPSLLQRHMPYNTQSDDTACRFFCFFSLREKMFSPKLRLKPVLLLSASVLALSGCETVNKIMTTDISPEAMINAARKGVAGSRFRGKHIVAAYQEYGNADNIEHGIIQQGRMKGQEGYVYTWQVYSQNRATPYYVGSGYNNYGGRTDYYKQGITNSTRFRYLITDNNHIIRDYRESDHTSWVQQ